MLSVFYKTEKDTGFENFPNNRKGNSELLKFIQNLYQERRRHPWYHNFYRIKNVESKLEDKKLGSRSKKKYQLETELKFLQTERMEILQKWGLIREPEKVIIEISHI